MARIPIWISPAKFRRATVKRDRTLILSAKPLSLFVSSHWIFSRRYRIYRKKIYQGKRTRVYLWVERRHFLENRGDIIGLFDMGSACCVSSSGIQSQYPESHEDGVNRGKLAENEKEIRIIFFQKLQVNNGSLFHTCI